MPARRNVPLVSISLSTSMVVPITAVIRAKIVTSPGFSPSNGAASITTSTGGRHKAISVAMPAPVKSTASR